MRHVTEFALAFAIATFALSFPEAVHAEPADSRAARADQLFEQARAALEAGRYEEACQRFAESQALDAANGTLLALAMCHEQLGLTATAWREFQATIPESERTGRTDRVAMVKKKLSALEPKLSKLIIVAPDDARVQVRIDGELLPRESWNKPFIVDPGDHRVAASFAGASLYDRSVRIAMGEAQAIELLTRQATGHAKRDDDLEVPSTHTPHTAWVGRPVGWVLVGSGVALLGVGTFFGVSAGTNHDQAKMLCPLSPCANENGVLANNRAKSDAWAADFSVGLGIAAVASGVILLLVKHDDPSPRAALSWMPVVDRAGGAVLATGRW